MLDFESATTRHFVKVTSESLSRLTVLIEEAASLLDERGGRVTRTRIFKEAHFAVGALRAVDNSVCGMVDGARAPHDSLRDESERLGRLKAPATERLGHEARQGRQIATLKRHVGTGLRLVVDNTMQGRGRAGLLQTDGAAT
ncbi:hypothetical protein [Reyranella sp.]|uniref:hypothetical protein n=1 Tax=Reyranella sp. TaxID=1929291 RepID=UPI00120B0E57|nr:hypothetical protein [Reyranella sp.]TAJ82893.1 MAG: hypothetical protein EPO50_24650 [Reyranella sp.]